MIWNANICNKLLTIVYINNRNTIQIYYLTVKGTVEFIKENIVYCTIGLFF